MIWISKRGDHYIVRWHLHGMTGLQMCESEDQARAFVVGFQRGMDAVKNIIGIGPIFDPTIPEG